MAGGLCQWRCSSGAVGAGSGSGPPCLSHTHTHTCVRPRFQSSVVTHHKVPVNKGSLRSSGPARARRARLPWLPQGLLWEAGGGLEVLETGGGAQGSRTTGGVGLQNRPKAKKREERRAEGERARGREGSAPPAQQGAPGPLRPGPVSGPSQSLPVGSGENRALPSWAGLPSQSSSPQVPTAPRRAWRRWQEALGSSCAPNGGGAAPLRSARKASAAARARADTRQAEH